MVTGTIIDVVNSSAGRRPSSGKQNAGAWVRPNVAINSKKKKTKTKNKKRQVHKQLHLRTNLRV